MEKKDIVKEYAVLARKLGKLPTKREIGRFLNVDLYTHFKSIEELKKEVLEEYPELDAMVMPAVLTSNDLEEFRLELEKKNRNKKNAAFFAQLDTLDYIKQFAEKTFKGRIQAGRKIPKNFIDERTHTLILSDLHIGADIKGDETSGTNYGPIEEARRLASIIKAAAQYKPQYRKNTKLVIAALGDFIENMMHDPRTGANISEQCCRAIHLMSQAIAYLCNYYDVVEVHWDTGNHDRITSRHPKRAIHQKKDSYGTIIGYAVKMALSSVPNVSFRIPKTIYGSYEVYGKTIGYTHGDTFLNPGNPYTTVNVKSLEQQINKLNAALPDEKEFAAFLYGHTHIGHIIYLSNGCVIIGNGGLPPPDHFAVSLGNLETNNGQWIFESVPGYPVGDTRFLKTGKKYDTDASLDSIIKPWKGL